MTKSKISKFKQATILVFYLMTCCTLLTLIIFLSNIAIAQDKEELARKAKQLGEQAAQNAQGQVNSNFIGINNHQLKDTLGYSGIDIKEMHRPINELEDLGSSKLLTSGDAHTAKDSSAINPAEKCNKNNCNINQIFTPSAALDRQEEMENRGFSKDENGMAINDRAYLDKALKLTKNAGKEFGFLSSNIEKCKEGEQTYTSYEQNTCDQYYDRQVNSCFPQQIVEIDPEYSYLCNKTREAKIKTCKDKITSIKCRDSHECDMGGIEPGSIASDMKFEHKGGILTIGTICDNCWSGDCAVYDRNTSFRIKNLNSVKEFTIFKVGFDDYLKIMINGHIVYVGPDGGNKLEVQAIRRRFFSFRKVDYGTGIDKCERDTNWIRDVSIDLKPYLKEGENNLHIRVIVSGAGEGWLQIRAKQNCCSKWDVKREEICDYS